MSPPDIDRAAQFVAAHGRVLDRRRFGRLVLGERDPTPVRDAVAAYRNPDGGFGHGLEPDARTPHSQPLAVELALRTLHEAGAWDRELVEQACDWLERTAPDDGGAAFVDPTVEGWPHAPWWQPEPGRPMSLIATGLIAATLHARRVDHPWLRRATEVLWERVEAGLDEDVHAYGVRAAVRFLDEVADRERARAAFERLVPAVRRVITVDPDAPGETHGPLTVAPHPAALARTLFDDATIDAHLDHLAAAQREDGGWTFNWLAWSPAATAAWRGSLTVDALTTLAAYDRLTLPAPL